MTVDFVTYCCPKDIDKLHENIVDHVNSHGYDFDNKFIVYQRCFPSDEAHGFSAKLASLKESISNLKTVSILDGMYNDILTRNGINPNNAEADDLTHGWGHSHYWRHHCVNHLVALEQSEADYIVMADADCHIKSQPDSWVLKAIDVLKRNPEALIVSPSDGSTQKKTQTMSQQLFLVDRKRLQEIDFDLPFEGFKEGGPMQEYYFMLEGRIGRYMEKNNLWRYLLDSSYRYWHKAWH